MGHFPKRFLTRCAWLAIVVVGCVSVGVWLWQGRRTACVQPDWEVGEAALAEAAALIKAYPQRDAGEHSLSVATWLQQRLGDEAQIIPFDTPYGQMANVVKPHPNAVAIFATHFDTKCGIPGFVGANDGASTTGLLLALAKTDLPITLLFLDGEECRQSYTATDGLQGSWHVAQNMPKAARLPVIVLDMLGDKDFTPGVAANGSYALKRLLRRAAKAAQIPLTEHHEIVDDHVPFLVEGWQAADVIDFDYGPENAWWHTCEDTLDKLSAESLAKAATLVRETVKLLVEEQR